MNENEITIDRYHPGEENQISKMVKSVFDEFVGIDYKEEGNKIFYSFIEPINILQRQNEGGLLFTAKNNNNIVGMIETKNNNHICLLFVIQEYQKRGIARKLLMRTLEAIRKTDSGIGFIEVNASPYSKSIYEKLGFISQSDAIEKNGMMIIPMALTLV